MIKSSNDLNKAEAQSILAEERKLRYRAALFNMLAEVDAKFGTPCARADALCDAIVAAQAAKRDELFAQMDSIKQQLLALNHSADLMAAQAERASLWKQRNEFLTAKRHELDIQFPLLASSGTQPIDSEPEEDIPTAVQDAAKEGRKLGETQ